jgi:tetratricopeptide (TPR) repeat protein
MKKLSKLLKRAIQIKPNYAAAWNNKGNGLNNLGRYEEAIKACDEAIQIKPDLINAWYTKGRYECMVQSGNY